MNTMVRMHGLGGLANLGVPTGHRRTVEADDVRWALANEHRMGFQAMARIRGVCRESLIAHVAAAKGAGLAPKPPAVIAPPPPAEPPPRHLPAGSRFAAILAAVSRGARNASEVADVIGGKADTVAGLGGILQNKGLLTKRWKNWSLTPEGVAELAWQAEQADG